jgi:hypothetical protein
VGSTCSGSSAIPRSSNVRVAQPEDDNATLETQCAGKDFIEEIDTMKGLCVPLYLRSAFRALSPA